MHTNSRLIFEKHARSYFRPGLRILEVGPDGFPSNYHRLAGADSATWDTLDLYEHPQLTYVARSEYQFPLEPASYDVVVSGQVLEHVRKPWVWLKELARVCKPGGHVITINPVSWPYHEAPIDCWRAYPEGMKALYEDSGLEVLLSQWESLEETKFRRRLPGRSRECQKPWVRTVSRLLGYIGFPVECAFDTITIGRKM